jgi:hypothetical protein
MDGSRFDRFTRAVSTAGSRRRLLGLVASLGLGGMLTHRDQTATTASSATTTASVRRGRVRPQVDDAATEPSEETTVVSEEIDPSTDLPGMSGACNPHTGPDSHCSATEPCCSPALCVAGPYHWDRCCLPTGALCNTFPLSCCSHYCGPEGLCRA